MSFRFFEKSFRYKLTVMGICCIVSFIVAGRAVAAEYFVGVSTNWGHLKGEQVTSGYDIAEPSSNHDIELVLSVKTLNQYFAKTSFGYYFELGRDVYEVERSYPSAFTRVTGEYWYVTPTVFYEFINDRDLGWSLKAGLGLGIGYLSAQGNLIFDQSGVQPVDINGHDINIASGIMIELQYRRWVAILKEYTPSAVIDNIDMKLELPALILGYRIRF